ncbi:hypothetical protein GQ457_03G014310 [Hibiscus cannabinus]
MENSSHNAKSDEVSKGKEIRLPPPFPHKLRKQKYEYQFKKFLDILKQVHSNLPLVEAIEQMTNYAKFLKDMVSKRTRLSEFICMAMLHNRLPQKLKDPDCEADEHAPIILGRPFLATGRMLIDCEKGDLTIRVNDQKFTLNIFKSLKQPDDPEECQAISAVKKFNFEEEDVNKILAEASKIEEAVFEDDEPKKVNWIVNEKNEKNELISTRTVTGWKVCMDYRKLNKATKKDHFPLPFIDQMLDRLAGKPFYCFLDGYSGYNQISIAKEDQEKTTFTCPFGTYAFRRMPFGLCNAPTTFQKCMMAIFSDMVEDFLEIFMDDFSVFADNFDTCLGNMEKVLTRCEKTDLVLNWEKYHFMVDKGIVLGHKISSKGIEVEKAKVDVIAKFSPPNLVKGVRSFLRHAGFYRRLEGDGPEDDDLEIHETFSDEQLLLAVPTPWLSVDKTHIRPCHTSVRPFDGTRREVVGKIDVPLLIGSSTYNVDFTVMDITPTYNCLLGRPWIHVARAIPSTLHQKVKFMIDGHLISVGAEEDIASASTDAPYIDMDENAIECAFQSLEFVNATIVAERKKIPKPRLSKNTMMGMRLIFGK